MTEVGVLESFTFMHSAINLNSQHEQFLKRIQSSIDELKVFISVLYCTYQSSDIWYLIEYIRYLIQVYWTFNFLEMATKRVYRMESRRFSITWQCNRATDDT